MQQHYAGATLEGQGPGRTLKLYVAGTVETVTLSAVSAASSSMAGSSATVSQSRLSSASDLHSNAAELGSESCEGESKLVQASAPDAMQGLRLDRAAGVQVRQIGYMLFHSACMCERCRRPVIPCQITTCFACDRGRRCTRTSKLTMLM